MSLLLPPKHLPPAVAEVWVEQVEALGELAARKVGPEFEAFCGCVARLRDAQQRIHEEELIVPDSKGAPTAHPAFAIERQCIADLQRWGDRYKRPIRA